MLGLEHDFRVVDVHVRLAGGAGGGERYRLAPDALEREMRQAGVVRSVVFPGRGDSEHEGGYLSANNAVARHSVDRPFVPFARLSGAREPDPGPGARLRSLAAGNEGGPGPEAVERYAYGDRFEGFVLDPAADGLPEEAVLEALADAGRPLLVRGGREFPPAAVERHLLGRPLPVILAHFGAHPLDRGLAHDAIDLLDEHGELHLDTSCVRRRSVLERALREHPDRVLFGSGAPAVHPNVAVMELLTLDVPEDAMRRAFERNATRLVPALAGTA